MAGIPDKISTWQMVQPTSRDRETKEVTPGKLEKTEISHCFKTAIDIRP